MNARKLSDVLYINRENEIAAYIMWTESEEMISREIHMRLLAATKTANCPECGKIFKRLTSDPSEVCFNCVEK